MATKSVIRTLIKLFAIALLPFVLIFACSYFGHMMGGYQERYVGCDPKKLLPNLESLFHISFPREVIEVKAAKTAIAIEGVIPFLVKFRAQPNVVDRFWRSFTDEGLPIFWESYEPEIDIRGSHSWRPPRWFTKPIRQGKVGMYKSGKGTIMIYVDTTDEKNFVVYLKGLL